MPKAASSTPSSSKQSEIPLKRNAACHQCRKRKLRCDAKRPCTTCIRSHSYAIRLAPEQVPPPLECTYDDRIDPSTYYEQSKLEALEAKINSLEAALHASPSRSSTDAGPSSFPRGPVAGSASPPTPANGTFLLPRIDARPPPGATASISGGYTPAATDTALSITHTPAEPSPVNGKTIINPSGFPSPWQERAIVSGSQIIQELERPNYVMRSQTTPAELTLQGTLDGTPMQAVVPPEVDDEPGMRLALGPPGWPLYVPPPELLHHLVETFFDCQPHAARLLHRASFTASLLAPPSSNAFPLPALLHAICAMASFYTAVVDSPPPPNLADLPSEELWPRTRYKVSSDLSFGDVHALWANMAGLKAHERGDRMVQMIQSKVVLSWYYYTTGAIFNVWITNGKAARTVLPAGLNVASNFSSLARHGANRTPSILPPAKSLLEEEERRNLLWLIYITERLQSAETCWAMLLEDEDISQYLPLPDALWNAGSDCPSELRQRLASPDALSTHPPALTSPFSLLVKSIALLSKVRTFNIRFRNRYAETVYAADNRSAPEFEEMDGMIGELKGAWPEEYADAFGRGGGEGSEGGKPDPTLYLASLIPSLATILLHDPHVDFSSPKCPSKRKMLDAVDVIMASIYQLSGTPHDIVLLDHYSSFCWVMAGMTLVRVLKAKLEAKSHIEAIKINAEIDIVKHILTQLGVKTVIGRRQLKILIEYFDSEIGVHDPSVQKILGPPSQATKTVTEMLYISQRASKSPSPPLLWENAKQWKYWA